MMRSRALYQMVRADFLERVRRYSFLLTMGFSVYLGYAVYAGQVNLRLDDYSGVDNSAWLGSLIGLVASIWLTLIGFYIVKNTIQRDRETRVGQILATTPISKSFYTLSKTLSNFAVLCVMVLVLALAALVIELLQRGDQHIDLIALFAPILVFGLSAVAVTAALAVLFESLPVLRSGVGNILYFFLWAFLLSWSVSSLAKGRAATYLYAFRDYTGIDAVMGQMQAQVRRLDPLYKGGSGFRAGHIAAATKSFLWTGMRWDPALVLSRGLWLGVAVGLALLAAVFFDRFDPARNSLRPAKKRRLADSVVTEHGGIDLPLLREAGVYGAHLTPLRGAGSQVQVGSRSRFFALVVAEFRLLFRGHGWWWHVGAAGLFVGCLASPLATARSGVIVAAWLWPALLWSQLGTREARFSTKALIFPAPHAFPRQLLSSWTAGVLLAILTGGGLGLHLIFARDFAGLFAWFAGALFIPALALTLGVCTESRKPFEAIYTAWWYIGPLHHIRKLDFMGTDSASSTPVLYLGATFALLLVACLWRRVRLALA